MSYMYIYSVVTMCKWYKAVYIQKKVQQQEQHNGVCSSLVALFWWQQVTNLSAVMAHGCFPPSSSLCCGTP